jgi:hypothetical protein
MIDELHLQIFGRRCLQWVKNGSDGARAACPFHPHEPTSSGHLDHVRFVPILLQKSVETDGFSAI